jgi:NADPH:quinone reductase-like Zn-dependent oxidoreductase
MLLNKDVDGIAEIYMKAIQSAKEVLLGHFQEGALQPTVAKVFPLSEAAEAVRYLIEDRPFGRVLMRASR